MNARRFLLAPAVAVTGLLALGSAATATTVVPTFVAGNPTCADARKLDFDPAPGAYTVGDLQVTITKDAGGLNWTSNLDVAAVIMKGGPNANVYDYPGANDLSDAGLVTPVNPNGNAEGTKNYGISHVTFCVGGPAVPPAEEAPPATPETPKAPETPAAPAPQVEATATPAAPAPEPVVEAQVLGTQLAAPVAAAPLELPRTGSQSRLLAVIGTALVAFGGVALALSGRPTRRA